MVPTLVTACIWVAAAGSVAFWVLQFPIPETNNAASVLVWAADSSQYLAGQTARALGNQAVSSDSSAAPPSQPYTLMGVISTASGQGSALIATDGQPAKAYRVGQSLGDALVLVSLSPTQAKLKSSTTEFQLDLPLVTRP